MAEQTISAELDRLRTELIEPAPARTRAATAAPEQSPAASTNSHMQIEHLLQELQSALNEVAEGTEDLIAEHPLSSVSAAFLLGIAVGWLAARS